MPRIFRQRALANLSSPERLDQRITLISRGILLGFGALLLLVATALAWSIFGTAAITVNGSGLLTTNRSGMKVVANQRAGLVEEILLSPGDAVQAGDPVLRLIDGSDTFTTTALLAGRIAEVRVAEGQYVPIGATVATVSVGDDYIVLSFLEPGDGKRVTAGMDVEVSPATVSQEEYGAMVGMVLSVSERPVSAEEVRTLLQDDELAELLTGGGSPILAYVDVIEDMSNPSGFRWRAGDGPPFSVTGGTLAAVTVTIAEERPLALLAPDLERERLRD